MYKGKVYSWKFKEDPERIEVYNSGLDTVAVIKGRPPLGNREAIRDIIRAELDKPKNDGYVYVPDEQ